MMAVEEVESRVEREADNSERSFSVY